jgi:hypothetical protein
LKGAYRRIEVGTATGCIYGVKRTENNAREAKQSGDVESPTKETMVRQILLLETTAVSKCTYSCGVSGRERDVEIIMVAKR